MKKISRRKFLNFAIIAAGQSLLFKLNKNAEISVNDSIYLPVINKSSEVETGSWPMIAANPERTSWISEEVRGNLTPIWTTPIEPYIHYKTQIITSYGKLFISTARGLYALNANNGNVDWIYPTELPLGNAPTISNGIVYVGGYDKKIYAIDAMKGIKIPTWNYYEAGAGFETNPIVLNNTVYAGNRDGYFYALNSLTGQLKWRYKTDGPILFSAAYKNGVLYFASNDLFAYAIKAIPDDPTNQHGQLVWKSSKFPGAGFHSYWPVIFTDEFTKKDYVIFSGSQNIFSHDDYLTLDRDQLFPNHLNTPYGTLIGATGTVSGNWSPGTKTLDVSKITNYLETLPDRRAVFILNVNNGQEFTFDSNGNGKAEYVPFTFAGVTHSGNKYPPVIGPDKVIYQFANYASAPWITRGQVAGWKFGTQFISQVANNESAVDEPMAYSMGGKILYWKLCCDRSSGSFDTTIPYNQPNRSWFYFQYDLNTRLPGYQPMYYGNDYDGWGVYGNVNGIYGKHGTQNPPIPYRGKLYMHSGNTIIAFGKNGGTPVRNTIAPKVNITSVNPKYNQTELIQKLEYEINKIVSNSTTFLRPGYHSSGNISERSNIDGDNIFQYFHDPSDTIYTLIQALPFLSTSLQTDTKSYLNYFYNQFMAPGYVHVGWKDGLHREPFDIPSEVSQFYNNGPTTYLQGGTWWKNFPPYAFYSANLYAQIFGGAQTILNSMKDNTGNSKLEAPPSDSYLVSKPYILNAYIAGYAGYLGLEKLATNSESSNIRSIYSHLVDLRVDKFSKDTPFFLPKEITGSLGAIDYNRALNVARNFIFLTPELGSILHDRALSKVQTTVNEYNNIAPYWFVSKPDAAIGESVLNHLYDYQAIFQAKAYILKEPRSELVKYLDVPSFEKGDLFYIQNLVAILQAY